MDAMVDGAPAGLSAASRPEAVSRLEIAKRRALRLAGSGVTVDVLERTERVDELAAGLALAIAEARAALAAGEPATVVNALLELANRMGVELSTGPALQMDAVIMARWPPDLFQQAYLRVWESFVYRRMPVVGEFKAEIAVELGARRRTLNELERLQERLEDVARRRRASPRLVTDEEGRRLFALLGQRLAAASVEAPGHASLPVPLRGARIRMLPAPSPGDVGVVVSGARRSSVGRQVLIALAKVFGFG